MTTNCDPMRCSHVDHACYLDDHWRCRARTGPGHMTNHEIFVYETHFSIVLYFNVFGLRSPGALCRKRPKYLQTHTQVVLFAEILRQMMLLSGNFGTDWVANFESHESLECFVCLVCQCLSWKTCTCYKIQNLKSETKLHILYIIYWITLLLWDWRTKL